MELDAAACGIFATAIPVLLVAGLLDGGYTKWFVREHGRIARPVLLATVASMLAGEGVALWGAAAGGLDAPWGRLVCFTALWSLLYVFTTITIRVSANPDSQDNKRRDSGSADHDQRPSK